MHNYRLHWNSNWSKIFITFEMLINQRSSINKTNWAILFQRDALKYCAVFISECTWLSQITNMAVASAFLRALTQFEQCKILQHHLKMRVSLGQSWWLPLTVLLWLVQLRPLFLLCVTESSNGEWKCWIRNLRSQYVNHGHYNFASSRFILKEWI